MGENKLVNFLEPYFQEWLKKNYNKTEDQIYDEVYNSVNDSHCNKKFKAEEHIDWLYDRFLSTWNIK